MKITKEESLNIIVANVKVKLKLLLQNLVLTARDLSMAYTPGVAEPCREIHQ